MQQKTLGSQKGALDFCFAAKEGSQTDYARGGNPRAEEFQKQYGRE
jgi:hypothetical protein